MQRLGKLYSRHRKQRGQNCASWNMLYVFENGKKASVAGGWG